MINTKMGVFLLAGFIAGAFVASPELRAYAANTIGSADIIDGQVKTADLGSNAVTSAKIKDGEVKTADIATGAVAAGRIADGAVGTLKIADDSIAAVDIAPDAVGASELQGVSKLIFAHCTLPVNTSIAGGGTIGRTCIVQGAAPGNDVLVTFNSSTQCFKIGMAKVSSVNSVFLNFVNDCATTQGLGTVDVSIVVFAPES